MKGPSFSVKTAMECFIFECSCSNMIVAYSDNKKRGTEEKHTMLLPVMHWTSNIYGICTDLHT